MDNTQIIEIRDSLENIEHNYCSLVLLEELLLFNIIMKIPIYHILGHQIYCSFRLELIYQCYNIRMMAQLENTTLLSDNLLLIHRELELLDDFDGNGFSCLSLHSSIDNRIVACSDLFNQSIRIVD